MAKKISRRTSPTRPTPPRPPPAPHPPPTHRLPSPRHRASRTSPSLHALLRTRPHTPSQSRSPPVTHLQPPPQLPARPKQRRRSRRVRAAKTPRRRPPRHLPVPAQGPVAHPHPNLPSHTPPPRQLD